MIIRKVKESDVSGIIDLYKIIYNFDISKDVYNYFYKSDSGTYSSMVAEERGRIIGHNAIINRNYIYKKRNITIGLSSGGMVDPKYSGIFYEIIKKNFKNFSGDMLIAFPNENSIGFFKKIFDFRYIDQNYYSLTKSSFKKNTYKSLKPLIVRDEKFLEKRIIKHPYHKYQKMEYQDTVLYYKKYKYEEIDIIYSSNFSENFYISIEDLLHSCEKINIVHWDSDYIKSLGFIPVENNCFVYKSINNNIKIFECQMIDSDVF